MKKHSASKRKVQEKAKKIGCMTPNGAKNMKIRYNWPTPQYIPSEPKPCIARNGTTRTPKYISPGAQAPTGSGSVYDPGPTTRLATPIFAPPRRTLYGKVCKAWAAALWSNDKAGYISNDEQTKLNDAKTPETYTIELDDPTVTKLTNGVKVHLVGRKGYYMDCRSQDGQAPIWLKKGASSSLWKLVFKDASITGTTDVSIQPMCHAGLQLSSSLKGGVFRWNNATSGGKKSHWRFKTLIPIPDRICRDMGEMPLTNKAIRTMDAAVKRKQAKRSRTPIRKRKRGGGGKGGKGRWRGRSWSRGR